MAEALQGWSAAGAVMTFAVPVGVFVGVCVWGFFIRRRGRSR